MRLKALGKSNCHVLDLGNVEILFSYEIPVLIWTGGTYYRRDEVFSVTTSKHINLYLHIDPAADVNTTLVSRERFLELLLLVTGG